MRQIDLGAVRTDEPLTLGFERVEDAASLESRIGLARLAQDTGGILVDQSNDFRSAFGRIDEDNQFHYLLTYSPRNTEFDGSFRAIKVRVRQPGVQVFARRGYRALRLAPSSGTGSYEQPALALLDRVPLQNAFPMQAAAFSFPDPANPGLSPVGVRVSTAVLEFAAERHRSTYTAQASVVVRIRDARGDPVQLLSQQYLLTGDMKDVEAAKNGQILFYREPVLEPGVYTIEAVVFDAVAKRGSVRVATLTVPPPAPSRLGMSSLVLVSRIEELSSIQTPTPS